MLFRSLQAIADKISADWTAGDLSALAIASAVRINLAIELARIDAAITTRLSAFDYTPPPTDYAKPSDIPTDYAKPSDIPTDYVDDIAFGALDAKVDELLLGHAETDTWVSNFFGTPPLGITTPGANIVANVVGQVLPIKVTTAASNGSWGLWLASGTWNLRFSKDGFYDGVNGDSVIELEVTVP